MNSRNGEHKKWTLKTENKWHPHSIGSTWFGKCVQERLFYGLCLSCQTSSSLSLPMRSPVSVHIVKVHIVNKANYCRFRCASSLVARRQSPYCIVLHDLQHLFLVFIDWFICLHVFWSFKWGFKARFLSDFFRLSISRSTRQSFAAFMFQLQTTIR